MAELIRFCRATVDSNEECSTLNVNLFDLINYWNHSFLRSGGVQQCLRVSEQMAMRPTPGFRLGAMREFWGSMDSTPDSFQSVFIRRNCCACGVDHRQG